MSGGFVSRVIWAERSVLVPEAGSVALMRTVYLPSGATGLSGVAPSLPFQWNEAVPALTETPGALV